MSDGAVRKIERHEIVWRVCVRGLDDLRSEREAHGDDYDAEIKSFQTFMAAYFCGDCTSKVANINPIGARPDGGKVFKVRWGTAGGGKSGGLRMVVVALCDSKQVWIKAAYLRRDANDADMLADAMTIDD